MTTAPYGFTRQLSNVSYDDALGKETGARRTQGFGVLSETDVTASLKEEPEGTWRRYKILGACNPPIAHQALSDEPLIGLLLPCNVVVFEEDDGTVNVSAIRAREMFNVVGRPELEDYARQVDERLSAALKQL